MGGGLSMVENNNIEQALSKSKVIPVIVIDDSKKALPLAETLFNSGITCAEVTLRTDAAIKSLEIFSNFDRFTLGAGTITNIKQFQKINDKNTGNIFICIFSYL